MSNYDTLRLKWDKKLINNSTYARLMNKLNVKKTATPEDVHRLAEIYAETLADTLGADITPEMLVKGRLPKEYANDTVGRLMALLHGRVQQNCLTLQMQVNQKKGLGIKPVKADYSADRVMGILDRLIAEQYENIKWIIESPVLSNFALNTIDTFCEKNIERANQAGVPMKLRRVLQPNKNTCRWCTGLAGEYEYPAPREVYKRHVNCRCITYTIYPGGVQDVWSKTEYDSNKPIDAVMQDIDQRNKDRDQLKQKQMVYRREKQQELSKANTMKELIQFAEKYGYDNPRGWAWHYYNARR